MSFLPRLMWAPQLKLKSFDAPTDADCEGASILATLACALIVVRT